MSAPRLLVTHTRRGRAQTQVWDGDAPLGIGLPFEWVLERTECGVRARPLPRASSEPRAAQAIWVASLESGRTAEIDLGSSKVSLRLLEPLATALLPGSGPAILATEPEDRAFRHGLALAATACLLLAWSAWRHPKPEPLTTSPVRRPEIVRYVPRKKPTELVTPGGSAADPATQGAAAQARALRASLSDLARGFARAKPRLSRPGSDRSDAQSSIAAVDLSALQVAHTTQVKGLGVETTAPAPAKKSRSFVSSSSAEMASEEGLSKEEVGTEINSHMSEIRYCHETALLRDPDVAGKLVLDFRIDAAGRVAKIESRSSSVPTELGNCVQARLKGWTFPKPKGGVNVSVSYPFLFKTLGRD